MSNLTYDRNNASADRLNAFSNNIKSSISSSLDESKLSGNGLIFSDLTLSDSEDDYQSESVGDIPDLITAWKAKLQKLGTTYTQVEKLKNKTALYIWDLSVTSTVNGLPNLVSYGSLISTIELIHPDGNEILEYNVHIIS
jgi:hypothetical protein